MNDASQENEIIRRWRAGQAQRCIARELGINRKRVARVVFVPRFPAAFDHQSAPASTDLDSAWVRPAGSRKRNTLPRPFFDSAQIRRAKRLKVEGL